jgi:hypothetical protein
MIAIASRQKCGTFLACTPGAQENEENPAQPSTRRKETLCGNGAGTRALQNRRKTGGMCQKSHGCERTLGRGG